MRPVGRSRTLARVVANLRRHAAITAIEDESRGWVHSRFGEPQKLSRNEVNFPKIQFRYLVGLFIGSEKKCDYRTDDAVHEINCFTM